MALTREYSRTLLASLLTLVGLSFAVLRLINLANSFGIKATGLMTDFEAVIYYPIVEFLAGGNPYNAERFMASYPVSSAFPLCLPMLLLVHLPFGLLSVQTSSVAYFILTLFLTFFVGFISLTLSKLKVRTTDVLLIGSLLLLSRPGHWNLLLGQVTLQFVLASYVTLFYAKRCPIVSGLGLAMSIIKPGFGLPLALLMLIQGHVRPVLYGGIMATLLNLPLVAILAHHAHGIDLFWREVVYNFLSWQQQADVDPVMSPIRIDAVAFFSHFIGQPLNGIFRFIIFISFLGIAAWVLIPLSRFDDERYWVLSTGILCLAVLLSIYHQGYDLLLLVLPLVGLVYHRFPREFYRSYHYKISVTLLITIAINYAPTRFVMSSIEPNSLLWLMLVSINSAALLTLFFLWVHAAHMLIRQRSQSPPLRTFSVAQPVQARKRLQ